jgi:ubiquinone/menaquinone biosynthesis C-methylase UbiE
MFNNIAPVYDTLNDVLSLGQHRIWKARRCGAAALAPPPCAPLPAPAR